MMKTMKKRIMVFALSFLTAMMGILLLPGRAYAYEQSVSSGVVPVVFYVNDGAYIVVDMLVKKLLAEGKLEKNPILEPIAAVSAGIVDGETRLDLEYIEDSAAQVDSNIVMTKSGKIIEFQTTAEGNPYERAQLLEILDLGQKAIKEIIGKY